MFLFQVRSQGICTQTNWRLWPIHVGMQRNRSKFDIISRARHYSSIQRTSTNDVTISLNFYDIPSLLVTPFKTKAYDAVVAKSSTWPLGWRIIFWTILYLAFVEKNNDKIRQICKIEFSSTASSRTEASECDQLTTGFPFTRWQKSLASIRLLRTWPVGKFNLPIKFHDYSDITTKMFWAPHDPCLNDRNDRSRATKPNLTQTLIERRCWN